MPVITPDPTGEELLSGEKALGQDVSAFGALLQKQRAKAASEEQASRSALAILGARLQELSGECHASERDLKRQIALLGASLQDHAAYAEAAIQGSGVLTCVTLDATPVASLVASIADGSAKKLVVDVAAYSDDMADVAAYRLMAFVKRVGGVLSFVSGPTASEVSETDAAWDATLAISGGNVVLQVTGAVDTTITWKASFKVI